MTTTELAIHAYALHRGPIWRSDAWAAPDHHLRMEAPAMTLAPYYSDEATTLYVGDCRDVLPLLDIAPAVVIADPPYGETSLAWDRWPDGWVQALPASVRQLWCFGSMRMFLNEHARGEFTGWRYGQEIVWEKHNGSGSAADRFKRVHEVASHWYRGPWGELTINPQYTTGHPRKRTERKANNPPPHMGAMGGSSYDSTDRLTRSVLFCHAERIATDHPTQKPLGILEPLIRYSTNPGDLILDPTAGAGSTLVAAKANGRRAIGIEANVEYAEAAARRLSATLALGAAS